MSARTATATRIAITAMSAVLFALVPACSKRGGDPRPAAALPPAPRPVARIDDAPAATSHGSRKLINLDVPVYVDGAARGVLRAGDLPALPTARAWNGATGFRLSDYFQAIGVPTESVRSVHMYTNGNRVGSVDGSELRADRDRFVFSFSSGDTGSPLARWSTGGLRNDFVVHEIRKVAVYVTKRVPNVDMKTQCIVGKDGACTDEIPYAANEMAKGTRVYVDGKIVGFVKRRNLTDAMVLEGKDDERTFSMSALVASFGGNVATAKGVELIAGDDVIARADGETWKTLRGSLSFRVPPHSHGKIRAHVPAEMQARDADVADKDGMITAIRIFKSSEVPTRELHAISDETDMSVTLARRDTGQQTE